MSFQTMLFNVLYCVLYGVVVLIATFAARFLLPYLKTKLSESRYSWASIIIENAVRAYEQMYADEPGCGNHKYDLVVTQVTEELEKLGIQLTQTQISTLIEAAVQVMNSEKNVYVEGSDEPKVAEGITQ